MVKNNRDFQRLARGNQRVNVASIDDKEPFFPAILSVLAKPNHGLNRTNND